MITSSRYVLLSVASTLLVQRLPIPMFVGLASPKLPVPSQEQDKDMPLQAHISKLWVLGDALHSVRKHRPSLGAFPTAKAINRSRHPGTTAAVTPR